MQSRFGNDLLPNWAAGRCPIVNHLVAAPEFDGVCASPMQSALSMAGIVVVAGGSSLGPVGECCRAFRSALTLPGARANDQGAGSVTVGPGARHLSWVVLEVLAPSSLGEV